jgi:endonuclease/exonuclease/phosphatase family metal-dependent hydrolase
MREFGIASIVMLLALSSVSDPETNPPQPDAHRIEAVADGSVEVHENLRLLTYNAFLRPPPVSWGDKNQCRARRIAAHLADEPIPRDIIALNETFDREHVSQLGEALEERFPHQILALPAAKGFRINGGLSLLSRYPIEFWQAHRFERCSGEFNDCLASKGFLWALVRVSEHLKVNVIVTHMNSGPNESAQASRRAQLQQIKGFMDSEQVFERWPTLLMGDLNVNGLRWRPRDPSTQELTEYARAMGELGNTCAECETASCFAACTPFPVDTFRRHAGPWLFDAPGTRQANTHNCKSQSLAPCNNLNDAENWQSRLRIDYIMHFGAPELLEDMSVQTLNSSSLDFKDNACGTSYLSDHQGIEATIEIRRRPDGRSLNADLSPPSPAPSGQ